MENNEPPATHPRMRNPHHAKPMKPNIPRAFAGVLAMSAVALTTSCKPKGMISKVESGTEIWIVPTNEELIVARLTEAVLTAN